VVTFAAITTVIFLIMPQDLIGLPRPSPPLLHSQE